MMKRTTLIVLLAAVSSLMATARVTWLEHEYDFGLMKEVAGPKTGQARFVNQGSEPVTVVEARPSCGCTGATFPEDPVAPGDTAVITFTYNPQGRPGRFDKTIKVRFADGTRQSIRITGNVLGTEESLAQLYPVRAGALYLSEDIVNMGNVTQGRAPSAFVNAYNQRPDSTDVSAVSDNEALRLQLSQSRAGAGDIVTIGLYFDSQVLNRPGPFDIPVTLTSVTVDGNKSEHTLHVRGTVVPVRKPVSAAELARAPQCSALPPVMDMGTIKAGKYPVAFAILNEGKSALNVSNVWCDNPGIRVIRQPERLKPGKSGPVQLELDTSLMRDGAFRIDINVASDDPVNPVIKVGVVGEKE